MLYIRDHFRSCMTADCRSWLLGIELLIQAVLLEFVPDSRTAGRFATQFDVYRSHVGLPLKKLVIPRDEIFLSQTTSGLRVVNRRTCSIQTSREGELLH